MNKMKQKLPTSKHWHVASTFNRHRYGYPIGWHSGKEFNSETPLPNVPMQASRTLLAELLRNGKNLAFGTVDGRFIVPDRQSPTDLPFRRKQVKLIPELTGKLLGVEIEYYPDPGGKPFGNSLTSVVSDGSLDSGGQEIRRITWASNTGRLAGLLSLKLKGKANKTCGLHVHVDARHLGEKGLLSVVQTYERLLELIPHFKKLVPKSRLRNRYCKWISNMDRSDRYSAINYQSFERHGTIEFRCQGGTVNLVKIESWALLCQFLLNWCANPVNSIPSSWAAFTAILPEPLRSWVILRRQKLYGDCVQMNDRSMSAVSND